jgi:membrane fusion protein, multidrug efflux system
MNTIRISKLVHLRRLALVGGLAGSCLFACKAKEPSADSASNPSQVAVAVKTEGVVEVEVPRVLRLTGTLRGNQEADIAANANGRVLSRTVERGQSINKGDVLAKLDTRALALSAAEAQAQVRNAQAQESQAQVECQRYEALKAKGAVTDQEYQAKMNQCQTLPLSREAASVRASLAAQNVGDGVIRAPFAGVVTERYVEIGQYLKQDSRVVTLVAVDPIRLELAVPEASVGAVAEGAAVRFRVSAYPERVFEGKIRFVSGALRASTRDLVVEALVDNADKLLRPGMFADAELTVGSRKLPSIAKASIIQRDDSARAYFVAGGHLEERIVSLGPVVGDRVSVERGARAQDQVVIGDLTGLINGQPVQ